MKTALIDYGSGNLQSAYKALELAAKNKKSKIFVTSKSKDLLNVDKIVLPGVGTFSDCMKGLKSISGMIDILNEVVIGKKKPFLGICVGMQLLATEGKEKGNHKGLGWIKGKVVKLKKNKKTKIPHMGWNTVKMLNQHPIIKNKKFESYFVHSYNFVCKDKKNIIATCDYEQNITAIVGKENIIGTQFHPEKSQKNGIEILKNFINWVY
ncbi:MAG: Imidazole glycerol phosphate synthase subunit HisH 1 [Alphaproteobacteria bacterium MarineAlpha6_Bin4]|nr:MAG: Imidazole glycerol phosphate synthase subunit HisH 1 [Alphaproteobacteria bacterium MarineAlpha6_Bin3]PPR38402.1 MAG: Imidazole glycerol phosphate synthase subunit HisH 1 [Alphaproteobacteria bacterium MarineAlpha6_Bin4]